jgi:hypothetical protein
VALADLVKDARFISTSPDADVRGLTNDFVLRRVRRLVELNPGDADPARPADITAAATRTLADLIAGELPKVVAASDEMWRRISADTGQLPIDPATQRKRGTKRPPATLKAARAQRRRLVRSIVYQAAAVDITLADPGGLDRLHRLCDRRLRIVERMVYDVGRADGRSWSRTQVEAHPGGPWPDGYERAIEYPRVPRSLFLGACRPQAFGLCSPPMQGWIYPTGSTHLHTTIRANPSARGSWHWESKHEVELAYLRTAGVSAVTAIQRLFEPSTDFLARNLLYCDNAIHALHLEALVFAMSKRGRGSAWLDDAVASHGDRWLRVNYQFGNPDRFLAASSEQLFFEHVTVRQADLQVGDHLIVYNHPAYAKATSGGVWKLENALVVQTFPRLLMQGHGTAAHTQGEMWQTMLRYFMDELVLRRADVEGLARVQRFAPGTVIVDRTLYLSPGMSVDIVRDDASETVLAADCTIVSISGRAVRYAGPNVSTTTPHRVRRSRGTAFDDKREAIIAGSFRIVRRVAAAASEYDGIHQRADWFLTWTADEEEEAIRKDTARAAFVRDRQLVEYTRERESGRLQTIGWFPLWRPSTKRGSPPRRNGRIVGTEPVQVDPRQIAGWTFFFDPNPRKRDQVAVIRPREL